MSRSAPHSWGILWCSARGSADNLGFTRNVVASPPAFLMLLPGCPWPHARPVCAAQWSALSDGGVQGDCASLLVRGTPGVSVHVKHRSPLVLRGNGCARPREQHIAVRASALRAVRQSWFHVNLASTEGSALSRGRACVGSSHGCASVHGRCARASSSQVALPC
jgi:hypothetical protein